MTEAKRPHGQTPNIELGKRISLRRQQLHMSQAQLARKVAVSVAEINSYETGLTRVGTQMLQVVASALQKPVTYFFQDENHDDTVESLLYLDSETSIKLLRAYLAIKNISLRRQFVTLVEALVKSQHDK